MCLQNRGGRDLAGRHEQRAARQNCSAIHVVGYEEDEETAGCDFDGAEDCGEEEIVVTFATNEELEVSARLWSVRPVNQGTITHCGP